MAEKNFFGGRALLLSQGLDDRPPPPLSLDLDPPPSYSVPHINPT